MTVIRIINAFKYFYVCRGLLQYTFAMFASLFDTLLQTFIGLFASVFDGLIINFVQSFTGVVAVEFYSLSGGMIGDMCAAICGGMIARELYTCFTLVCVLVVVIYIETQSGLFEYTILYCWCMFYCYLQLFGQSPAIFIECSHPYDATTNGLLHFSNINWYYRI